MSNIFLPHVFVKPIANLDLLGSNVSFLLYIDSREEQTWAMSCIRS